MENHDNCPLNTFFSKVVNAGIVENLDNAEMSVSMAMRAMFCQMMKNHPKETLDALGTMALMGPEFLKVYMNMVKMVNSGGFPCVNGKKQEA